MKVTPDPGVSPSGAQIASLRRLLRLTQAEAAEALYVHRRTWQDWERDVAPMPAVMWEYLMLVAIDADVRTARRKWHRREFPVQ